MPTIVIQDDHIIRALHPILDPGCDQERRDAFADYYSVDMSDFEGWCETIRARYPEVYPSEILLAKSEDELREMLPRADLAVVEEMPIREADMDTAPRLKFINVFRADTRNIDIAAAEARGIGVRPLHRRVNRAVAEHAFALLMALAKKLAETNKLLTLEVLHEKGWPARTYDRRHTANSNWARISGIKNLRGSTLGIVGLGSIGRDVARWANAFDMTVLYHQRNRLDPALEAEFGARYVPLDELLGQADFVSIHVPLTDATRGLIDADAFAKMKPGAVLVNVSRADIVDREALLEALRSGKLGGVGFDVHYSEPAEPDEPLFGFDNVVLSPHIAIGNRHNGAEDMEELVANLAEAMRKAG